MVLIHPFRLRPPAWFRIRTSTGSTLLSPTSYTYCPPEFVSGPLCDMHCSLDPVTARRGEDAEVTRPGFTTGLRL